MLRAERAAAARQQAFTPMRRGVLTALAESNAPLGAYDLAERVSADRGKRVNAIQIYRTLHFLMSLGLVHRIATRNAYFVCDHQHGPDETVVFLVCRQCGNVAETISSAVGRGLRDTVKAADFRPLHCVVEIEGECALCRRAALVSAPI
jgi:Fur family zinc uptake transcriptional regulator